MNDDSNEQMVETIEECGLTIVNELKKTHNPAMELSIIDESGVWVVNVKRLGIVGDDFRPRGR